MKSISRTLRIAILSVLLISLVAACNTPIGSRGSNGSSKPPVPVATQAAQPPAAQPTAQSNPWPTQPANPKVSASQATDQSAPDMQADPQGNEIEQSLNDLTSELDATDTLDDLK